MTVRQQLHVVEPAGSAAHRPRWPWLVTVAVAGVLAAAITPHFVGFVVALVVVGAVVRFAGWASHPKAPIGPPTHSSAHTPSLVGIDGELAARRLRPLTPAQHAVVERWATEHVAPYEPFPDLDEEELCSSVVGVAERERQHR